MVMRIELSEMSSENLQNASSNVDEVTEVSEFRKQSTVIKRMVAERRCVRESWSAIYKSEGLNIRWTLLFNTG